MDGHCRVLGVPDGLEAQVLGLLGHECRVDGVGRQGHRCSDVHVLLSSFDSIQVILVSGGLSLYNLGLKQIVSLSGHLADPGNVFVQQVTL